MKYGDCSMDSDRLLSKKKLYASHSCFYDASTSTGCVPSIVRIICEYSVVKIVDRSGRGQFFECYHGIRSEGLSNPTQSI